LMTGHSKTIDRLFSLDFVFWGRIQDKRIPWLTKHGKN